MSETIQPSLPLPVLRALAQEMLLNARLRLEVMKEQHFPSMTVTFYDVSGNEVDRMEVPSSAGRLLNIGSAKGLIFALLRERCQQPGIAACLMLSDVFMGKLTPAGELQTDEQINMHVDLGFTKLVALGWATVTEMLQVVAQTPEHVLLLSQAYTRDVTDPSKVTFTPKPTEKLSSQQDYGGRTKMWGATEADAEGVWRRQP